MAWFKTTDTLMGDPKVMGIPLNERGLALGTWIACGTWSSQQLTDGKVPAGVVESFVGTISGAESLVAAGMWRRARGAYLFVNWAKYQPTKREIEEKRDEERRRVSEWRERKRASKGLVDAESVTPYVQERTAGVQTSRPDPSRPVPSRIKEGSPLGGNSPKQAPEFAPQPCGDSHDPKRSCGACADARRKGKTADADKERDDNRRQRAADVRARRDREAEAAATEPTPRELIEAAKARVKATVRTTKESTT